MGVVIGGFSQQDDFEYARMPVLFANPLIQRLDLSVTVEELMLRRPSYGAEFFAKAP